MWQHNIIIYWLSRWHHGTPQHHLLLVEQITSCDNITSSFIGCADDIIWQHSIMTSTGWTDDIMWKHNIIFYWWSRWHHMYDNATSSSIGWADYITWLNNFISYWLIRWHHVITNYHLLLVKQITSCDNTTSSSIDWTDYMNIQHHLLLVEQMTTYYNFR